METDLLLSPTFSNLVQGLIGAAIASSGIWLFRRIRNLRLEHKYSLTGYYKSEYEDVVDGEKVIQKDKVYIKQRGLNFDAEAANTKTGRSWGLEGEIDDKTGYIYGYYKAQRVTDASLGVFVFQRNETGNLEGMWAGYDSQNKNISQGLYTMEKYLPVQVRKAKKKDISAILHIASKELGEGYMNHERLMDAFKNHFLFVAEYEGRIIGFSFAQILEQGSLQTQLKAQKFRVPAYMDHADKTGTLACLRSVAVDSDYQKKGAGSALVKHAMRALKKSPATHVISLAWKTETAHIGPILESENFDQKAFFENFWYEESRENNSLCPQCGNPCHCPAILYSVAT